MPKVSVNVDTGEKRYKTYSDLNIDELESMVKHLETDSKRAKNDHQLRKQVLGAVQEAKEEIAKRLKK